MFVPTFKLMMYGLLLQYLHKQKQTSKKNNEGQAEMN